MNVILCEYVNKNKFDAGNKARSDALKIALESGYKHVSLFRSGANKIIVLLQLIKGCIAAIFSVKKDDNILIQYPYYPNAVNKVLFAVLRLGKKIKKYKLTLLIHDVLSLRNEKLNSPEGVKLLQDELTQMDKFDKIICHNEKMKDYFNNVKKSDKYVVLSPFDYLYDGSPVNTNIENGYKVIVAGNLTKEKCSYLYKMPEYKNICFNLYGVGYEGKNDDKVSYKGKFPPDKLIENLQGNFGLVWDGESCETCSGVYGQYLKYNNPHKFSLYIASGIALIVWSQSALADYVRKNNIGICIDSLEQLDEVLGNLDKSDYEAMVNNVKKIREEIVKGEHLKNALRCEV